MTLLTPLALVLVPLVAVLLILNSRRPTDRRAVGNLYLWQRAADQSTVSVSLRRLRRHWLLVLQTAFMLAVIAALARPLLSERQSIAVFVFDVSASMSATEGAGSRIEEAKARAMALLPRLSTRDVHAVTAASVPRDLGVFRRSDPRLERAIGGQTTTAAPAALGSAIRLARAVHGADVDLYVFSDAAEPLASSEHLHWVQVGTPGDNLAITALATRPGDNNEVLVGVTNRGGSERDTSIELRRDETPVSTLRLRVASGATATTIVRVARADGILTATLSSSDRLSIDDRRLAVVSPRRPIRVLLVETASGFLERALAANPEVELRVAAPGAKPDGAFDVIACDRCDEAPGTGDGVLWVRGDASAPASATTPVRLDVVPAGSSTSSARLLTRSLELLDAAGIITNRRSVPASADVIIRGGGEPAVVAYEDRGRRTVEVRLDLQRSTLPVSIGFPVLIANAVEWLSASRTNALNVTAGEPLRWRVPEAADSTSVEVVGPAGTVTRTTVERGMVTFADTALAGVYRVRGLGAERRFAVNPASATESDLSAQPADIGAIGDRATQAGAPRRFELTMWLIAGALACLAGEWWLYRRLMTLSTGPTGRTALWTWRAATAALVALGATGLTLPFGDAPLTAIFVVDRSDSIPPRTQASALARVKEMIGAMRPGDRAGLVTFGADVVVDRLPTERFDVGDLSSGVSGLATNVEQALAMARQLVRDDTPARLVLVSDGRETAGTAQAEAARAAAAHVAIDTVAIGPIGREATRARIRAVSTPQDAHVREPVTIRVDLEGLPGRDDVVEVYRNGQRLASEPLRSSSRDTLEFTDTPDAAGLYTYTAAVVGGDGSADRDIGARDAGDAGGADTRGAVVSVSGTPSVLYVGEGPLASTLSRAGFAVTRVPVSRFPATGLRAFSTIVLERPAVAGLTPAQLTAIDAFVQQTGGGLLVLAGDRRGDSSALVGSDLQPILPVDFRPRAGRRDLPIGLVLVFDKSGSMADRVGGISKIEIAREAARKAIDVLPRSDAAGIVAFDSAATAVVPFGASHDANAVAERLRSIQPGGSTAIAPAVAMARDWLAGAKLSKRYILLVSDGRTSAADAARLRESVRGSGVELSTVAIGSDADRELLRALAESSGGRAYFPDDVRELPSILAREAARAAGGATVNEAFTVRAPGHPITTGLDARPLPTLGGYTASVARPGATTVLASHLDDPVLAGWQIGLGRAAVFTSDLGSSWTTALQQWPDAPLLWAQTIRWLERRASGGSLTASLEESARGLTLLVDAERGDGQAINLVEPRVSVRTPEGKELRAPLTPVEPGRYEADIPAANTGTYAIALDARDDKGADVHMVRGVYWTAERERRTVGIDAAALAQISAAAGGHSLGPGDSPFAGTRAKAHGALRPAFLTAALLVFLLDIASRKGRLRLGRARAHRAHAPEAAA